MKKTTFLKTLLVAALLMVGANAWADDWTTVWTADFSSAPSGMTYSVTNGSTNLDNGYLHYNQGGGSGNRAINTAFTADAFNVTTNWKMEFDWNCSASNQNSSSVTFATDQGNAFTITWANGASTASITDASSNSLTTTLPTMGTTRGSASSWAHFTITGDTENGIYLTVTKDATTYVNNVNVSATYGYPKTFNGSLGRAYSWMYIDNVSFATPKVAGFVATPTGTITKALGTSRKFTLSCLTDDATIYYATSDIEIGAAGWNTYSSEVTTSAATIYVYASDGVNNSAKGSFATGAGTTVSLATPTISVSGFTNTTGLSVNNPTFTFACDNSAIVGAPTATLSYTFTPDGGVESSATAGASYTPTAYGTLKVIASADGYNSSEKSLVVSSLYTISFTGRDYTTATTSDISTEDGAWGDEFDVSWTGWETGLKANILEKIFTEDQRFRVQNNKTIYLVNGWGWVRYDKSYNYQSRYSNEGYFVGLKTNTSKGSDTEALAYPTVYCSSGTGQITDLVTINVPAGNLVQQLYFYEATPTTVSKTISAAGWATYCSPYALDFSSSIDNLSAAYLVVGGANCYVTKSQITGTIPANTGILLRGEGVVTIPVVASSSTDVSANKLIGKTAEYALAEEAGYVLMNDATNGVGFYQNENEFTVGANTAYLPANFDGGTARSFFGLWNDGETTGIKSLDVNDKLNDKVFDLQGRHVAQPTKGLYIVNGKKVVIK